MAKSRNLGSGTEDSEEVIAEELSILEPEEDGSSWIIEDKLESDDGVILSIDVDGPITDQGDGLSLEGRSLGQVAESLGYLAEVAETEDDFDVVLNSGNPKAYLDHVVEELSKHDERIDEHGLDLIGGMGTEYRIDGREANLDVDKSPMVETQQRIYSEAAEEGWCLNIQNNKTGAVWVNRIESEQETESNPAFDGEKNTEDLWSDYLEDKPGFEFRENYDREAGEGRGAIVFDNDYDSAETLLRVQRQEEEFIGLRFEKNENGEIMFYRQQGDREVNYDRVFGKLAELAEGSQHEWSWNHYDDGGFEIWDPEFCGKGEGLNVYRFVKGAGHRDSLHHGDSSSSDYVETVNSYIIPQEGTSAERNIDQIENPRRVMESLQDVVSLAETVEEAYKQS